MPRRIAVEMKCARCGRVWYADYDPAKGDVETTSLELTVKAPGGQERRVEYDALCDVCVSSVAAHVDQIDKKMEKASPQRRPRAKKSEEKGAPAATPAPPTATQQSVAKTPLGTPATASPSGSAPASGRAPSTAPAPQTKAPQPS